MTIVEKAGICVRILVTTSPGGAGGCCHQNLDGDLHARLFLDAPDDLGSEVEVAARVQMQVGVFGDDTPGVVFEGTYIVLPAKPFGAYEEGGNEEE